MSVMEENNVTFVKWKDIKLFHNLVKSIATANESAAIDDPLFNGDSDQVSVPYIVRTAKDPVIYKGKIKLHGSNAAVAVENGQIKVQSRNQFVSGEKGFGSILHDHEVYWKSLSDLTQQYSSKFTVFGEYCAAGVQKGVACCQLNHSIFAVFAIDIGDHLIIEPDDLKEFLTANNQLKIPPSSIYVLPWHTDEFRIEYNKHESDIQPVLDAIESKVNDIDQCDPWIKSTFNVDGPGEGLVMYPINLVEQSTARSKYKTLHRNVFGAFAFKAKGKTHRVVGTKKSVSSKPEIAAGAEDYANLMCPDPRFEQGVTEAVGAIPEISKMNAFLAWVVADVQKEGQDELSASGLEWKDVHLSIMRKSAAWYLAKCKALKESSKVTVLQVTAEE
jgi:hypothetical protein